MKLSRKCSLTEADAHKNKGVRVRFVGERVRRDPKLVEMMNALGARTIENDIVNLTIAFSYGGRDEVARATTIVRFAPGSAFAPHTHDGGEEYIVLEGVFQDEAGDFPVGTYVRNPPTTAHTPGAEDGCTIFVKLWQFDPEDRTQFRKDMNADLTDMGAGITGQVLHKDDRETVRYIVLAAGKTFEEAQHGGTEVLMISGTATEGADTLAKGAWLRLPEGAPLKMTAQEEGAAFWIKTGHLPFAEAPAV